MDSGYPVLIVRCNLTFMRSELPVCDVCLQYISRIWYDSFPSFLLLRQISMDNLVNQPGWVTDYMSKCQPSLNDQICIISWENIGIKFNLLIKNVWRSVRLMVGSGGICRHRWLTVKFCILSVGNMGIKMKVLGSEEGLWGNSRIWWHAND